MIGMFLSVGAGGAIGAMTRYGIAVWMAERYGAASWTATLAVNIAGCFLMGIIAAYLAISALLSEAARGFLAVGFLGGLTTFSSFALDGYGFWLRGDMLGGAGYISASVLLSLASFSVGFWLFRSALGAG